MNDIIILVKSVLMAKKNIENAQKSQHFFKESLNFYGVSSSDIKKIANNIFKKHLKILPKAEIIAMSEHLIAGDYFEEKSIACLWMKTIEQQLSPEDMLTFDRWLDDYVNNWATCDMLCNHAVATLITNHPQTVNYLMQWSGHSCRWKRRAAAVSLIIPARKGLFLDEIIQIVEILLFDQDDLVQKGYGWMLKAASEAFPKPIYDYVIAKKAVMPRTAFRYALEKMPEDWRKQAMKKGE